MPDSSAAALATKSPAQSVVKRITNEAKIRTFFLVAIALLM
jgi:hypothetical protein